MGLGSRVQARLPFRSGAMTKYPYDIGRITDETLEQLARVQFPTQRPRIPGLAEALPGSRYLLASPVERVAGRDPPAGEATNTMQHSRRSVSNPDMLLAETTERFFPQDDWRELIRSCGRRQSALERISRKPDGFLRLMQQRAAELPTSAGAEAREAERID